MLMRSKTPVKFVGGLGVARTILKVVQTTSAFKMNS